MLKPYTQLVCRGLLLLLVLAAGCAGPLASIGAAGDSVTFRGRSKIKWRIFEPGVSWTEQTVYDLNLRLTIDGDGNASLWVNGRSVSESSFRERVAEGPRRTTGTVDQRLRGKLNGDGLLVVYDAAGGGDEPEQVYRCGRISRDASGPAFLLRCIPQRQHDGLPWDDPLPPYLRLPLILGLGQPAHVTIAGEQGETSRVEDLTVEGGS